MNINNITDKQMDIYRYILRATKKQGFPPSVREIGHAVGLRSPSTVHTHLKALETAGLIDREGHKTRAIRTLPHALLDEDTHAELLDMGDGWRRIPVVGRVTAGRPILAVEEVEGYVPFQLGHSGGEFFGLRVRGDSMIEAGICDGDTVVVRRQPNAEHGEIVVGMLEDEATVKRFYRQRGRIFFMPENPAYEPIDARDAVILGKVVGLFRAF